MSIRELLMDKHISMSICKDDHSLSFVFDKLFRHAVSSLGDGVIITDAYSRIIYMNQSAERHTGWQAVYAIGRHLEEIFVLVDENSVQRYFFTPDDTLKQDEPIELPEHLVLINRDITKEINVSGKCSLIRDEQEQPIGIIILFYDITEQIRRENEIRYHSFYDHLTGLYNRAFFEEEIKRLDTERMLPLSILLGDANGLKLVNDAFGHAEGDRFLKQVANVLKEVCRKEDIIARIGGDEFVIILPNVGQVEAQHIIQRIKEKCDLDKSGPVKPSLAIGVATKDKAEQGIHEIIGLAEEMMYEVKLIESKNFRNEIIHSIRHSLEERNHEPLEHGYRLKNLSLQLGRRLGLNEYELVQLELLSMLHDIGKIAIPESILTKPTELKNDEWKIIRRHCEIGYRIAVFSPELVSIAEAILSHHEHWDGSGYPQGLSGESIPFMSRIISIIDAFDSMTNDRPFQKAISVEKAKIELQRCAGTQFDPSLVKHFLEVF